MTNVSAMAEPAQSEAGARVAKDAIDPDLIKLSRARPKIGVITAAGLVFLCIVFLIRLGPDRRFGMGGDTATPVVVADVLAGKVGADTYVALDADPLVSHAIRAAANKGNLGLRLVPARGTGERLWLVVGGDGWDAPAQGKYTGRLRPLGELAFAGAVREFAAEHPRPMFAAPTAVRAGFASGKIATVTGDEVAVADADQVAFDVVDPAHAVIVISYNERLASAAAWTKELTAAGIAIEKLEEGHAPVATPEPKKGEAPKVDKLDESAADQARVSVAMSVADATAKLEGAKLFAARVEPVTRHYQTTWAALRGSAPTGFTVGDATLPDAQIDLVGLYVARGIPSDAYALVTTDVPADYWYMLPITIAVALIGLVFAWAFVRAVRRDLLPPAAA